MLPRKGVQYMLWAVLYFAVAHASVKFLPQYSFLQLVFLRQLIAFVLCVVMMAKAGVSPWGRNKVLLVGRGLAGTISLSMYFYSLQNMPLASAVTIQYLAPILTLGIAHIWLKERTRGRQWLFASIAFIGVLLVKGFDPRITTFELLISLGSVFFSALAYNTVRALRGEDHELVIVLYFTGVSLPLVLLLAAIGDSGDGWSILPQLGFLASGLGLSAWRFPTGSEWPFVLSIGVFTWAAQICMTKAYKLEPASQVAIYNYLGVILALGFGYYLFHETFNWMSLVGMAVILTAVALAANVPR